MDNQADKGNNFEFWDNLLDQLAGNGKETGMEEVSSSFTLSTPMAAPAMTTHQNGRLDRWHPVNLS